MISNILQVDFKDFGSFFNNIVFTPKNNYPLIQTRQKGNLATKGGDPSKNEGYVMLEHSSKGAGYFSRPLT